MREIARGAKVFDHAAVRGRFTPMEGPDDVLDLMDRGADGVVALVRDAGATFLAPIYHELTAIICTSGTVRSHIGIVSREFQVPCAVACTFVDGEPAAGALVELDCSGAEGRSSVADVESVAAANRLIAYHAPISKALTQERTSLESALIPVTAYIVVACAEAFLRYPEMMRRIDAAMPAEEIGRRARRPGCQVDTCYLWSISNFFLLGRKIMVMLDPSGDDPADTATVLDFWERAAIAYRGDDGTRQAWDTGTSMPYPAEIVAALLAGVTPILDEDHRAQVKRFSATLVNHLFLLYFDTRAGYGDTGPYPVPDEPDRTLLVRDFYRLAHGDFPWSDVAKHVPYHHLTAALVLEGVQSSFTDFGTSNHTPEDYLDHLVGFALYTTDDLPAGEVRLVPPTEYDEIIAAVRTAQGQHYRNIAGMTRDEKIRAGAYVYFSFLRPFAEVAGVAAELDWSVPRDLPGPAYELLSATQGENAGVPDEEAYYEPYPEPVS